MTPEGTQRLEELSDVSEDIEHIGKTKIKINGRVIKKELYPNDFDFNLIRTKKVKEDDGVINYNNDVLDMHLVD